MRLCTIDFETANQNMGSACSIGIVVSEGSEIIFESNHLLRPHHSVFYFDPKNISIHNILPSDVEYEVEFDQVFEILRPWFETSILMAHNAIFDMTVLRKLFQLYKIDNPRIKYIDSLEIARKMLPRLQNHRLNTVCEYFGIELNHHDALSDARGSCLIALNAMAALEDFDLQLLIDKLDLRIGYII